MFFKVGCRTRSASCTPKLLAEIRALSCSMRLSAEHLSNIGLFLENYASAGRLCFRGSSGIEAALAAQFNSLATGQRAVSKIRFKVSRLTSAVQGRCCWLGELFPVTSGQIAWALKRGFAEVPLDTRALASANGRGLRFSAREDGGQFSARDECHRSYDQAWGGFSSGGKLAHAQRAFGTALGKYCASAGASSVAACVLRVVILRVMRRGLSIRRWR